VESPSFSLICLTSSGFFYTLTSLARTVCRTNLHRYGPAHFGSSSFLNHVSCFLCCFSLSISFPSYLSINIKNQKCNNWVFLKSNLDFLISKLFQI
jgi:hypothetical protein